MTAIFSALVWAASSALIGLHAASLSGSGHMLRTLRGWALAALIISAALWLFRRTPSGGESAGRQFRSALSIFGLFSVLIMVLVEVFGSLPAPWAANLLTFFGGVIAPVIAVMALEFPDLRPRALLAGALVGGCLVSCAFVSVLIAKPAPRPGIIRTKQPANPRESPRLVRGPARA